MKRVLLTVRIIKQRIWASIAFSRSDLEFFFLFIFLNFYLFMIVREREREAETQAEGEAGSMHWESDVGLNPGSPGSRPGPKAGTKLLHHLGFPSKEF